MQYFYTAMFHLYICFIAKPSDDASGSIDRLVENCGDGAQLPPATDQRWLTASSRLMIGDRQQPTRRDGAHRSFDVHHLRIAEDDSVLDQSGG